jgi:hypothetical protein
VKPLLTLLLLLLLQLRRELTELHNSKAKLGKEISRFHETRKKYGSRVSKLRKQMELQILNETDIVLTTLSGRYCNASASQLFDGSAPPRWSLMCSLRQWLRYLVAHEPWVRDGGDR